jgi:tetratricopeptide (TPR) repeat protein
MADWNAEEWFHEGCRLTEEAELESAINALRNAMSLLSSEFAAARLSNLDLEDNQLSLFPDPAEVNFHLADALYRTGRVEAAVERYYCAIESAPDFIEAWTQLGCLQSELDQPEAAEQSLVTAISIHPENPDALLHCTTRSCWTRSIETMKLCPFGSSTCSTIRAVHGPITLARTITDVRTCFTRTGAKLGPAGSVAHLFDHLAVLSFKGDNGDAVLEAMLDADVDVDDVECEDGRVTLFAAVSDFYKAKTALLKAFPGTELLTQEITFIPQANKEISADDVPMFEKFMNLLNDCEDVQEIYHNAILPG